MLQEEWGCKQAGVELCVANLLEFNWYPNTDTRVEWNNDTSMNVHADTDTDTDMGKSSIPILIPISEEYKYRFQKILINFYRYPMFYWYQYLHLINTNTDTGILDHTKIQIWQNLGILLPLKFHLKSYRVFFW